MLFWICGRRFLHASDRDLALQHPGSSRSRTSKSWLQLKLRHDKGNMPEQKTLKRVKKDKREGKAPSTQAGEFIREEMHHIREGVHGARSTKQAIAIGLSKARRAGVDLPPPEKGTVSEKTRKNAQRAYEEGQRHPQKKPSPQRSRATLRALQREGHRAASHEALSRHAHRSAQRRTSTARSAAARKAARTRAKHRHS